MSTNIVQEFSLCIQQRNKRLRVHSLDCPPYSFPGHGTDCQTVADFMINDIQYHVDYHSIVHLVRGHQDGCICSTHIIVEDLPLARPFHRGPGLGLPDIILKRGDHREGIEERRKGREKEEGG